METHRACEFPPSGLTVLNSGAEDEIAMSAYFLLQPPSICGLSIVLTIIVTPPSLQAIHFSDRVYTAVD